MSEKIVTEDLKWDDIVCNAKGATSCYFEHHPNTSSESFSGQQRNNSALNPGYVFPIYNNVEIKNSDDIRGNVTDTNYNICKIAQS